MIRTTIHATRSALREIPVPVRYMDAAVKPPRPAESRPTSSGDVEYTRRCMPITYGIRPLSAHRHWGLL